MPHLIPKENLIVTPWKNGGGSTTEIAIHPAGANFDNFDWRVSLATIAESGPFSVFPGVDRTIALVDGAGIILQFDDARRFTLTPSHRVFQFPGEARVEATLKEGETRDFNVMTRRARCRHEVERFGFAGSMAWKRRGPVSLLFLASGKGLLASDDEHRIQLHCHDALLFDHEVGLDWTLAANGRVSVFVVDFSEVVDGR